MNMPQVSTHLAKPAARLFTAEDVEIIVSLLIELRDTTLSPKSFASSKRIIEQLMPN
jgi:hypothetical protein